MCANDPFRYTASDADYSIHWVLERGSQAAIVNFFPHAALVISVIYHQQMSAFHQNSFDIECCEHNSYSKCVFFNLSSVLRF